MNVESIGSMVIVLSLVWLMRAACLDVFPGPTAFLERMLRRLASSIWELIWIMPVRGMLPRRTLWAFLIFLAVSTSAGMAVSVANGDTRMALFSIILSVATWGFVVAFWYLVRLIARRRYTPRPLPTRRRERR
jgi:hypothetical protein